VEIKYQLDATDEFLLQILLLAQHASGTIMPIIRSSRVLYKWLLPVVFGAWFSSCRCSVELMVVCPVCGQQPANRTSSWHFISTYCRRCTVKTTSNFYKVVILSPHPARQLYRTGSLHPPGNFVRVEILKTVIKETHCSLNRRFNISETEDGCGRTDQTSHQKSFRC
jgi:hypothetical protein